MFKRKTSSNTEDIEIKAKELEIILADSIRDLEELEKIDDSKELLRFIAKQFILLSQFLRTSI